MKSIYRSQNKTAAYRKDIANLSMEYC